MIKSERSSGPKGGVTGPEASKQIDAKRAGLDETIDAEALQGLIREAAALNASKKT